MSDTWRDTPTKSATGLLTLLGLPGVGPKTVKLLSERLDVLGKALQLSRAPAGASAAAFRSLQDADAFRGAYDRAVANLATAERLGVRVLTVNDEAYPSLLASIEDPPPVLFVKGELANEGKAVAVIGTRKPTDWGREQARSFVGGHATSSLAAAISCGDPLSRCSRNAHRRRFCWRGPSSAPRS